MVDAGPRRGSTEHTELTTDNAGEGTSLTRRQAVGMAASLIAAATLGVAEDAKAGSTHMLANPFEVNLTPAQAKKVLQRLASDDALRSSIQKNPGPALRALGVSIPTVVLAALAALQKAGQPTKLPSKAALQRALKDVAARKPINVASLGLGSSSGTQDFIIIIIIIIIIILASASELH
jgi:putative modified peptide